MKGQKAYNKNSWSKILIVLALLFAIASIIYTTYIANELKKEEHKKVKLWAKAQKEMFSASEQESEFCDYTIHSIIMENTAVPMIMTDEHYRIIDAINFRADFLENPDFFEKTLNILRKNSSPIIIENEKYKNYIFYKQSTFITNLSWLPFFQLCILAVLVSFAFLIFSYNRQAEQERVWVGMAKETAHQLGTPISSLMGWLENIKLMYPDDEDLMMMTKEMNLDVDLLKLVADRFSKIGTIPELQSVNVYDNLEKHLQYVQQRASRKITFDFPNPKAQTAVWINVNPLLFDWVIENLLKNALDALDGQGNISAKVQVLEKYTYIDLSDSGKGIPKGSFKKIFEPGYSTKKRGWGLGLSLCKRIVEKYHNGKIYVLQSEENKGATFRIQLPYITPEEMITKTSPAT